MFPASPVARGAFASAALILAVTVVVAVEPQPDPASSSVLELRWGGDAEGGAPFVEADPSDPTRLEGFDVEIAGEIARGLGRTARFVQVAWESIDASTARGDFDIGKIGRAHV